MLIASKISDKISEKVNNKGKTLNNIADQRQEKKKKKYFSGKTISLLSRIFH